MDIKELFLKQKEAHRDLTRKTLPLIPADKLDWRPEKDALSPGELLRHMWMSEEGVCRVALDGDFAYYEARVPQGLRAVLGEHRAKEEEIEDLERVHSETLARVADFPLERFEEERAQEELGFRRKVHVILYGIIAHEIHHRAQLMTYLRLLGAGLKEPRSFRR